MSNTEQKNNIIITTNPNNGVVVAPTLDHDDVADIASKKYYDSLEFLSVPMIMKSLSSPRRQVGGSLESAATASFSVGSKKAAADSINANGKALSLTDDTSDPVRDGNHSSELTWWWSMTDLKFVPLYHPISPTALTIHSNQLPLKLISARVTKFMRLNSISCNYDGHNATGGRVDCLTQDLLQFTVQFWKGKPVGSIILEVLHTQGGCQMEMQQLRGKLYHAIETGVDYSYDTATPSLSSNRDSKLREVLKQADFDYPETTNSTVSDLKASEGSDVLGVCLVMLRSGQEEQIGQALKYLCLLTDSSKTSADLVDRVSRVIVFGDDDGEFTVKDVLWHYFAGIEAPRNDGSDNTGSWDDDNANGRLQYAQGRVFGTLHLLGLRIISQALESVAWQKKKSPMLLPHLDFTSLFWKIVEEALLYNLNIAEQRPLEAALSAKCIRLIQSLEPKVLGVPCSKTALLPSLFNAHQFGRTHHRWLEHESRYLIGRFATAH